MKLDFRVTSFVAQCSYEEREIPRALGFMWHPERQIWFTQSPAVASKLREYATPEAKSKLSERFIAIAPWAGGLPPSVADLMPHQRDALDFVLSRNRSYLALDPGLGKTAVAACAAQALADSEGIISALYVTPPFLVRNVQAEFARWAPGLRTGVLNSRTFKDNLTTHVDVLVLPDTFLQSVWLPLVLREYLVGARMLIVDEAHRFKNDSAQRTQSLFGFGRAKGIIKDFPLQVYMSGTPMPNRPIELYPVLSRAAPEVIEFKNKSQYGERYCAGVQYDYGWDFSGASNMRELAERLVYPAGPFMLRMRKDLLDLPPKLEQIYLLSDDMAPKVQTFDQQVAAALTANVETTFENMLKLAVKAGMDGVIPLAAYRRLLGEQKAKDILPFIKSILEETDENLIVYGYHKEAIKTLATGLSKWNPFVITGETPMDVRHEYVGQFQTDTSRRLFIGNYLAMGVGFTLTRATRVIFVEFSWVPGENDQASDRPHRIGQTKSVLVQYVTFQGSVDETVIKTLLNKKRTIKHV